MRTTGRPRWLDAEEQKAWRAWLYSTLLLQDQLDRELTRETGISHAYYEILVQLSEAPEPGAADEPAGRAVAVVAAAGSRTPCPGSRSAAGCAGRSARTDGRGQLAVLTDEGFAALEAAAPVHVEGVRTHLFDQLTPEQVAALRDIGETLLRHLGPR